jgi:uncharacterized protein YjdB/DNA-directed RNA polymerase subunit RPC12/RpoP
VAFEVKCSRCDRRYSGFRTRCPYCGARRSKKGKRAEDDNSKLKLIIGLLLLLILIVAVIVLVVMAVSGDSDKTVDATPAATVDATADVNSVDSTPIPTVEPTAEPTPTEEPVIGPESVTIKLWGKTATDITVSVGESYDLTYGTTPEDAEGEVTWTSSDEDKLIVLQSGNITAIASGTVTVTVKVGDVESSCIVRIK